MDYHFCPGGPKNYGYQLENGKTGIKVRGITLNCRSSQIVNFNTLTRLVKNLDQAQDAESVQVYEPNRIVRESQTRNVYSQSMYKDYELCMKKELSRKISSRFRMDTKFSIFILELISSI